MRKKELIRRYILFLTGLFFMGIGIAFARHGELGVSPISSIANILSYKFTFFSMGTWLNIWNLLLIAAQAVILKKDFRPFQLLQIPISFLLGYFTDFGVWVSGFIPIDLYAVKLGCVFAGMFILGFGIALTLIANVIMNAGEAFVKVLADILKKDFGNVKIVFDISCVAVSVIMSLILFEMQIVGTREGTVIAALGTGFCVKLFCRIFKNSLNKLLTK